MGVACDLGYPCAKFRLPRPFGFRIRADVRDIRRTDGQTDRRTDGRTTDADHRIMPPRRGHNKHTVCLSLSAYYTEAVVDVSTSVYYRTVAIIGQCSHACVTGLSCQFSSVELHLI